MAKPAYYAVVNHTVEQPAHEPNPNPNPTLP